MQVGFLEVTEVMKLLIKDNAMIQNTKEAYEYELTIFQSLDGKTTLTLILGKKFFNRHGSFFFKIAHFFLFI